MKLYKIFIKHLILVFILLILSSVLFGAEPTAKAYLIVDAKKGNILYGKNIDLELPMASTTKIMTALLVLENEPLSKIITYDEEAKKTDMGNMFIPAGSKLSVKAGLSSMLLLSSNDMSVALAKSFCSKDEFINLMNEKAKEIGMNHTHFVNPHGLNEDNHYSTCYDLSLLSREAVKNKDFLSFMKSDDKITYTYKGKTGHKKLRSTFGKLYSFYGLKGIKTGYTRAAKKCFVGYVVRGDVSLISVILGSKDAMGETKDLVNYTIAHCDYVTVLDPSKDYIVNYNKHKIPTKPLKMEKIYTNKDNKIKYKIFPTCHYPIKKNTKIGKACVYDRGRLIDTVPLFSKKTILCSIKDGFITFVLILIVGLICYFRYKELICYRKLK